MIYWWKKGFEQKLKTIAMNDVRWCNDDVMMMSLNRKQKSWLNKQWRDIYNNNNNNNNNNKYLWDVC